MDRTTRQLAGDIKAGRNLEQVLPELMNRMASAYGMLSYYNMNMELSVLLENARRADAFEIFEAPFFETLSVMLDVSRCGVPQKSTVFRLIDTMAVMVSRSSVFP